MGLCKCPKRRVTNQFCFEHRVNVCEHCLVTNHPKCIVQSYLQWLQDSDYNPICEICTKDLESEDCIRLTCYHVYHWWCLNDWARSLPADLAPAGYTCPSCRSPLFPPSNLVSPVADVLREKLSGVNWARTGLGLPLLSDEVYQPIRPNNSNSSEIRSGVLDEKTTQPSDHSILHIPAPTSHPFARSSESSHHESTAYAALPRRAPHEAELRSNVVFDRDEDKYKRKRFRDWMFWKRKSLFSPSRGRHQLRFVLVLFVIVGLVFILFKKFGSDNDEYDANFDVRKNPQIHIQENKISIEHES